MQSVGLLPWVPWGVLFFLLLDRGFGGVAYGPKPLGSARALASQCLINDWCYVRLCPPQFGEANASSNGYQPVPSNYSTEEERTALSLGSLDDTAADPTATRPKPLP